jgi:hypothetical protein
MHQAADVSLPVVLRDTLGPSVQAMLAVFEDSILLPHVPPLKPLCTRPGCHDDRDTPLVCLTKNRGGYTEYSTSISFHPAEVGQRSGLTEHTETQGEEVAARKRGNKDFS